MASAMEYWLLICLVMFIAGIVKGIAGLGLPAIAVSLLILFLPVHHVLGLVVLPLFFGNCLQACQSGKPKWVLVNFWPFLVCIAIVIFITSVFVSEVNERIIYLLISLGIGLFLVSQNKIPKLNIDHHSHKLYAVCAGTLAGVLGGLTTVWGPPTVIYLRILGLKKEEFVRAAGWIFLIGSLPLLIGYWVGGIFTLEIIPAGLIGSALAMLGIRVGRHFRSHISEQRFILIVDVILGLIALNLLRKAVGY